MTARTDLTRWNRAGLSRFRYVDGNAPAFLELLRDALARRFGGDGDGLWRILHAVSGTEDERERLRRVEAQYGAERRDMGWEIARVFARACHILTGYLDAYANEGFIGTATQWDHVRRLVEMLDYHPAPPASAFATLALVAKPGASGLVPKGFQMKYAPASGAAVTFETLEDVSVDAALNELRPLGYGRNPTPLTDAVLTFDGAIKHLQTGEPVVLEDDRTGTLRGYVIQGVLERPERTEVTVRPPLWHGFVAGHTIVHAQPVDRLTPKGPTPLTEVTIDRVLHLADPPGDLQAGEVVYVSDSTRAYYRRVVAVRGRIVVFDKSLGELNLGNATVARPQLVSVNRLTLREPKSGGGSIRTMRIAGDYSRLVGTTIADLCIRAGQRARIAEYTVSGADFIPGEQAVFPPGQPTDDSENAGYTMLRVSIPAGETCTLVNPQSLWVPPIGGGWAVDRFLLKSHGHLPAAVRVTKPKKTAGGDIATIVRGNQIAWARLASVDIDAGAGEAVLKAENGWRDRGGGDFYLADTWVYAHFKQQLRLSGWRDNRTTMAGIFVDLDAIPAGLRPGAKLLIESAGSEPVRATVVHVDPDRADPDRPRITLSRALPPGCTVDSLVLRGNIVSAGHGEAKSERVLGSGSATQSNQTFVLQIADVSFIADSTQTTGVRADIAVRIAGPEWKQVATLNDSGPADAHYVVRMTEDGYVLIGFGDGTNGRRLPTGTNNVRVSFREGTGLAGNIPAGSLTKPAKPHALVASVRQLAPATGGNDMEGVASLRENAPASLLTLESAVSLSDFGFLAGSHSSVWQARALAMPTGLSQREQIEVVVVPANGSALGELAGTLQAFLLRHAVPGVAIKVTEYKHPTFSVNVALSVDEEAFVADDVLAEVKHALRQAFALVRRRLGQDVFLSEVYQVVEGVPGVTHSTIKLNDDPQLRRIMTDDRSVHILGDCTIELLRETEPATPGDGGLAPTPPPTPAPARPIGRQSSIVLDGVGAVYAQRLAAAGSRTVHAVAAIDPDRFAVDMPRPKLWEAVAKAQLLLDFEVDVGVADAVLDRPLIEVAAMTPAALTALTRASATQVTQLRGLVRRLQVALDDEAFARLTLREFVPR